MKHIFLLQLRKITAPCLLLLLFTSLGIFFTWFTWQAFAQWADILHNYLNQADHYLLSLRN